MQEKYLSKDQMQAILDTRPKGVSMDDALNMYVKNGWTIQGVNEKPTVTQQAKDLAVGFAKGAGRTGLSTLQNLQTIGQGTMLALGASPEKVAKTGFESLDANSPQGKRVEQAFQPTNQEQKIGGYAELGTEAILGGGGQLLKAGAVKGVELTGKGIQALSQRVVPVIKEGIKPSPNLEQALGQVLQGKTTNIKPFETAIKAIDTKGVKTYKALKNKFDEAIPSLAQRVDTELAKDVTPYTLEQLAVKTKSKGGQEISTDYVTRALDNLKELYKTTGDDVAKTNIDEIVQKATTEGLTRKEVNDISRVYNQEFGSKAFSKVTGDALTSVNAQAYENTRKGLKDIARAGIGGDEAKAADEVLSSIYDSKKLIERNVEAVNKLKQRIEERGWISKATYGLVKAIDTVSGGVLRGATDAVLNRGTGLKTLNALDIEANLDRNLGIIRKALNAESEKEVQSILKPVMDYAKELKKNTKLNTGFVDPTALFAKNPVKINNIVSKLKEEDVTFLNYFLKLSEKKKLTKENVSAMDDFLGQVGLTAKTKDEQATIANKLLEMFNSKKN